jgi:hypothetical protein
MRHPIRSFIISVCASISIGYTHLAMADIVSDTETILNWAENAFPEFFPEHQTTQSIEPWLFRYYPQTDIYAGINTTDYNAYVLGGPFGNEPVFISSSAGLVADIAGSGGNGDIPACNTANIPEGFVYRQSGNVIEITTNGQCIKLPRDTNLCEPPGQPEPGEPVATGISVLTKTEVLASEWRGVQSSIPLSFLGTQPGSSAVCILNTPTEEQIDLIINSDICLDVTEEMQEQLAAIPGVTVTPPIGQATKMTVTSTRVADCLQTDAETIYDMYTNEILRSPVPPQIPDIPNLPGL